MEVVLNKSGSISIGGSNSSIIVDPQEKGEKGSVILFLDVESSLVDAPFDDAIVIAGAGEYEVGEFSIHGEQSVHGVSYEVECNNEKLLLLNASDIESMTTESRFGTVVVRLDGAFDEGTSSTLPGELVLLYGAGEGVDVPKVEKMDKVGKRKKSELVGQTILLSR